VRVEAAVLVDNEHGRVLSARLRLDEVAGEALHAGNLHGLRGDASVVLGDDLGVGVVVLEQRQEGACCRRPARQAGEAVEEAAAVHAAMRVFVE
jgi:hypothetical protein